MLSDAAGMYADPFALLVPEPIIRYIEVPVIEVRRSTCHCY